MRLTDLKVGQKVRLKKKFRGNQDYRDINGNSVPDIPLRVHQVDRIAFKCTLVDDELERWYYKIDTQHIELVEDTASNKAKKRREKAMKEPSTQITFTQKKVEDILRSHIVKMMGDGFRESEIVSVEFVLGKQKRDGKTTEGLIAEIALK